MFDQKYAICFKHFILALKVFIDSTHTDGGLCSRYSKTCESCSLVPLLTRLNIFSEQVRNTPFRQPTQTPIGVEILI